MRRDYLSFKRILICGSRDWTNSEAIHGVMRMFRDDAVVIHGGCQGADTIAGDYWRSRDGLVSVYPANWNQFGKAAGPIRNQRMLDEGKPDLVLAFHPDLASSKGTRDMVSRALKAGVFVQVIRGER